MLLAPFYSKSSICYSLCWVVGFFFGLLVLVCGGFFVCLILIHIYRCFFIFVYKGLTLMYPLYHMLAYGQQEVLFLAESMKVWAWGTPFTFLKLRQKMAPVSVSGNTHTSLYVMRTSMQFDHSNYRKCNSGNSIYRGMGDKQPPKAEWFKRLLLSEVKAPNLLLSV